MKEDGSKKEELSSAAWEDLGYSPKPPRGDKAVFRIPMSPIPNHSHESEAVTQTRKERCILAILSVIPNAELKENGMMVGKVEGRVFEFFPASDTWYSYAAAKKFGCGIEWLCDQIRARLLNQPTAPRQSESP